MIEHLATPHDRSLQRLLADHGGEYIGHDFERCCEAFGTRPEFSAPCTPSDPGRCKLAARPTMTVTRCLLKEAKLPRFLRTEIAARAVYLLSRIPNDMIGMEAPYHRLLGKDASLAHRRTIGAGASVHQKKQVQTLTEERWGRKACGLRS